MDRKLAVLIICLAALCVIVGQAGAYVYTFQNASEIAEWPKISGAGTVTVAATPYLDTNLLNCAGTAKVRNTISFPTNYWAYTAKDSGITTRGYVYDSGGSEIIELYAPVDVSYTRIEIIRENLKFYVYRNGALYSTSGTIATVPYFFGIQTGSGVDDIVIGTTEEHNVVEAPPSSWFVAKDIFDSGFSGLYSAPDTQVYSSVMHVTYANDDGASTIAVANVATGTVVNTTSVTGYAGFVTLNLTTMLFNTGAPYGQYRVYMSDISGTAEDYFWYKGIATSGTQVQWDAATYTQYDDATMTFAISETNWITDDYSYKLEIWDSDLNDVREWAITSRPVNATQTYEVNVPNFGTSGTYYAVLTATDLSSYEEILLTYDECYVDLPGSGEVWLNGITYNATDGLPIGDATVSAIQLGVNTSTISDTSTGAYSITSGLVTSWSMNVNASKPGYSGIASGSWTPESSGTYTVNIPLVPAGGPVNGSYANTTTAYYNTSMHGTALGGLCFLGPYWTIGEGVNCTLSNTTWSNSTLVNDGGWYQLNHIPAAGTYTLTCSLAGYDSYVTTCSIVEGTFNRLDVYLDTGYLITMEARDLSTLGLLSGLDTTFTLSSGETLTTTTGLANFTLEYGSYDVTASSLDYYPSTSSFAADAPKTITLYLQEKSGGSGTAGNYYPHNVRFTIIDSVGNPITDATITCTPQDSSSPWTWLTSVFGFDVNATDIAGTALTGDTGSDGTCTFLLVEVVEYSIHVVKASAGIDHTITMYPKESEYIIRIGALPTPHAGYPTYLLNASQNTTNVTLSLNYNDTLAQTTALNFIIRNSSGTEVYNGSVSLTGGSGTATYTLPNTKGEEYTFGMVAENSVHGTIQSWKGIVLQGTGRLVDFGAGFTDQMYIFMSIACIFLIAGCFGELDVKIGAFFVPFLGAGFFWYIGWLPYVVGFLISIAAFLGVLYYIRSKAPELDK